MATRRQFLRSLGGAAAVAGHGAPAPARPNIVYILADDLGYGDLRCYHPASKVPTPEVDRLASQGVRFTDAHSPSAVCTPTRYGIMTGRYCWRSRLKSGVLNGYSPALLEPDRLTVPAMLKRNGYATACIGKWHLGLGAKEPVDYAGPLRPGPVSAGFDYFYGIPASLDMPPYLWVENERAVAQPAEHVNGIREHRGVFWREGAIAPEFRHADVLPTLGRKAVEYLETRKPGQPFFLYLALTGPHTPWLPAPEFRGKAAAGEYGDFVAMVDATVGRVLAAIEQRNMAADTLVVFTSDNGAHWLPDEIERWGHRANHLLRGQKADIWDGRASHPFYRALARQDPPRRHVGRDHLPYRPHGHRGGNHGLPPAWRRRRGQLLDAACTARHRARQAHPGGHGASLGAGPFRHPAGRVEAEHRPRLRRLHAAAGIYTQARRARGRALRLEQRSVRRAQPLSRASRDRQQTKVAVGEVPAAGA